MPQFTLRSITGYWLFFLCLKIHAQQMRFENISTRNGLISDEVYNLHQDKQGYIWAFTNYGAVKYNGRSFKPVLQNLGFDERFIYCIYENSKGNKWVANNQSRIFSIRNDSAFVVPGTDSISEFLRKGVNEIYQLYVDDSLNIYAITKQHSYRFWRRGSNYIAEDLQNNFTESDSLDFVILERGGVMLPVYKFTGEETFASAGKMRHDRLAIRGADTSYFRIRLRGLVRHCRRYGNSIFVSSSNDVLHLVNNKKVKLQEFRSFVLNFSRDNNGHLWVACYNDGLYEYNSRDSLIGHYFKGITVNHVLHDSQDGLWVSTTGSGLFYCPNKKVVFFSNEVSLGKDISLIKKLNDTLMIGTVNGELYMVGKNKIELVYEHSNVYDVLDIYPQREGYLLSFRDMVSATTFKNGRLQLTKEISDVVNTFKILYSRNDTILGLHRKGITIIHKGKLITRIDVNYKTYDALIRGDSILLATEKGLFVLKQPLPFSTHRKNPLLKVVPLQPGVLAATQTVVITRLIEDNIGGLYMCSRGSGLLYLDSTGTISSATEKSGLPSNFVNDISFTEKLTLLSTNKGLFYRFSDSTSAGNGRRWRLLYAGEVKSAVAASNKLYLSTRSGLALLENNLPQRLGGAYFNLSELFINGSASLPHKLSALMHHENSLEFNFDYIDFQRPQPYLNFRIEGAGIDSGIVRGNSLLLQKLKPGNYTLTVYPRISGGRALAIVQPFHIKPAFWQTSIFRIIAFTLFIVMLIVLISYLFRYLKNRQEKKTTAEKLILEYKLVALKAQVNPHFVSNCLTAIQHLIINNKVETATRYIARFGYLVRQILNFSTRSLVTLREELEIAELYIELEQLRFENKFNHQIIVDENIKPGEIYVPSLILNPLIENAIWHGLLPPGSVKKGLLKIKVGVSANVLVIEVIDNGSGFKHPKKPPGNIRESKGLRLTTQRLANINYLYGKKNSRLFWQDNLKTGGAIVTIELPPDLKPLNYETA